MGDKDRTKLSRIKANLPIDIAQPVCPVDVDGNPLGTVAGLKVEVTDGTDTLDVITQDAAFGTATKGIALFGKYEVTPTAYADGDAVPIKVDANGRVVLESDIQLGAVELKNGTTDDRAIIKDGNTAAVADDALLVADANVKTVLTDASQKTQIVDGSGNVIGATSNRLNVDTVAEDNFENDIAVVNTWVELPKNIKAVSFILDCSDSEATLEYTFDRSASPAHAVESELGTLVNDVAGGYLAGAVGQIRMNNVVSNEVVAVPTVTKITFATAVPTTGDTVVFGDETYEFTTDSETELTAPTNIRIDMDALSITDEITAAQGFKTVFNENTAYDVAGTGDAAVITLTASANFEDYNDLATTTSITATATATYEDTTFGGGTGDSTTGVDAVAATLPKLWIIGIK